MVRNSRNCNFISTDKPMLARSLYAKVSPLFRPSRRIRNIILV